MKTNYCSWVNKINDILNKENIEGTKSLQSNQRYNALKKWLDENKVIYKETFDFPIAFGPFSLPGCKSVNEIQDNTALFFIPRSLMILSSEHEDLLPDTIDEDDEEDKSTLILTLFLLEEERKENSFFKPYIDLLPPQDYTIFWDEKTLKELDNNNITKSTRNLYYEIYELYSKVIKCHKYRYIPPDKFASFFCHVLSRQFYIDDSTSALIPGADLLNHNTVKIKYEIYDSENNIFKYTAHLCNGNKKDLQYTKSSILPISSPSYNKYEPIQLTRYTAFNYIKLEEEDSEEEEGLIIDIRNNDYFVLSTSSGQFFKKGEQVYSNYSNMANKTLLKYYGFCLLGNKYDYTVMIFSFYRGKDPRFEKYLEIAFRKKYSTTSDPFNNIIKLKIKYKAICYDLIRYYRFMHLYNHNRTGDFLVYTFERDIEVDAITQSIKKINADLSYLIDNHTVEEDKKLLEELLKQGKDSKMCNIVIFRLQQKINLLYQIDLMNALLKIIKEKKINNYLEILDYIDELENISEYNTDYLSKKIIRKCITKQVKL